MKWYIIIAVAAVVIYLFLLRKREHTPDNALRKAEVIPIKETVEVDNQTRRYPPANTNLVPVGNNMVIKTYDDVLKKDDVIKPEVFGSDNPQLERSQILGLL